MGTRDRQPPWKTEDRPGVAKARGCPGHQGLGRSLGVEMGRWKSVYRDQRKTIWGRCPDNPYTSPHPLGWRWESIRVLFICTGKGRARVRGRQTLEGTCCAAHPPKPGVKLLPPPRLPSPPGSCSFPTPSPQGIPRLPRSPRAADCGQGRRCTSSTWKGRREHDSGLEVRGSLKVARNGRGRRLCWRKNGNARLFRWKRCFGFHQILQTAATPN